MKKLVLFTLFILLLLLPTLASADDGYIWYKDIKVEKNISSSLVAGSTDAIIVSFKNPMEFIGSLLVRLNITEITGNYPVEMGDFDVKAILNSTSLYPGYASSISEMVCKEKTNGIFYCFNLTDIKIKKCIIFDEKGLCWIEGKTSYIVLPKSTNNLTLYVTSNPALIPSNYNFKVDLFKELKVPKVKDPVINKTTAGIPTLFNASEVNTLLWITTSMDKDLEADVIFYEFAIEEQSPPAGLIPIKTFSIELNDTEGLKEASFRVYYNKSEIPSYVDENSLRIYYYNDTDENPENWDWQLVESGVNTQENYVWANITHLSLFGIFGLPKKELIPGLTIYLPAGIVYQNVTQNVTIEKEKPIYIEKEIPAKLICGNNVCEAGENCLNCPKDCKCPSGYECVQGVCLAKAVCGNGICEKGENNANCPEDCPIVPAGLGGITGAIIATVTNPIYAGIIALIIIAIILSVLSLRLIKKSCKFK
jgi:hypothetical protein